MTEEQEKQIEQDIRDEIWWLNNGRVVPLGEGDISTIMAILRIRLNSVEEEKI